jgi:hypothetical protein
MAQSSLLWSASHGFEVAACRNKTEQSIVHISTIIRPNLVPTSCGSAHRNNVSEVLSAADCGPVRTFLLTERSFATRLGLAQQDAVLVVC